MSINELWLPVNGFPNTEVSDLGRVRSLFRGSLKMRSLFTRPDGYVTLQLQNKQERRNYRVHVLVMEAFVGPKPPGLDVNHKDGDKGNNRLSNLEYITRSENHRHAFRLGLAKSPFTGVSGDAHHNTKITDADVRALRESFAQGVSRRTLATRYGLSYYTVWDITTGRSRKPTLSL